MIQESVQDICTLSYLRKLLQHFRLQSFQKTSIKIIHILIYQCCFAIIIIYMLYGYMACQQKGKKLWDATFAFV